MRDDGPLDIAEILADGTLIDRAVEAAVREALRGHKLAGNPVADWQDGKVVWILPEQIEIPDDDHENDLPDPDIVVGGDECQGFEISNSGET